MTITTNQESAACERSDRRLRLVLGSTLDQATLRLVVLFFAICVVGATIVSFAR